MKVSISTQAYVKIHLHACKYPHKSVNGLLLGSDSSMGFLVEDAIPLFHQCLGLAPMLEVALAQVDTYCQQAKLHIVGYYQANEHVADNEPDGIAHKIADKIHENSAVSKSLLVMLNNLKIDPSCSRKSLEFYAISDSKWKPNAEWDLENEEASLTLLAEMISSKTYQSLVDFDNHLDDVSQDWLNEDINKLVNLVPN